MERVVVASSDKAYGAHDELPYREDFALRPTAPYEASKAAADLIARSYWPSYGLPVAVTRFANIYGGGDLNFSRLVPEAVCAALDGRAPVLRSDGSPGARLPLRRGRRRRLPGDRRPRSTATRSAARRSTPAAGAPTACGEVVAMIARLAGTGVEPDIRGTGNPAGEIDRQYVEPASSASSAAGSHGSASRTDYVARSTGTPSTPTSGLPAEIGASDPASGRPHRGAPGPDRLGQPLTLADL